MVKNPRTPIRPDRLRPLNSPREVALQVNDSGHPLYVTDTKGAKKIEKVLDTWRVDDEWWRNSISRNYYELLMEDGSRLIIFNDLSTDKWFSQSV